MLSRGMKEAFYIAAGPLMKANGWIHRTLRAPRKAGLRVQLGPGQAHYIPGWVNVDANMFSAKCEVWADLRNRLPFRDNTVEAMYSHHVIEHLPDLRRHFEDVFRCLQPGGIYRFGGPNGDNAIRKFIENDANWFADFPDSRKSIGGRFENFVFCRQEHLTILTFSHLEEILMAVGFVNLRRCAPTKETSEPEIFNVCLENENEDDMEFPHTLLIEARKPS